MKSIVFYLCAGLFCARLFAQDISDCRADISAMYQNKQPVDLSKGYKVRYTVKSVYRDKTMTGKEMAFTMIAKNEQVHVLSEALSTYADKDMIVSVSSYTKTILINANTKDQFDNMLRQTVQIPDSVLWKAYTLSSCRSVSGNASFDREAVLSAKNTKAEVGKITFRYRNNGLDVYQIVYDYAKTSPLEQLSYTFYETNRHYTGNEVKKGSVYHLFFDAKGHLLPAYKNYEVIDQRINKTNP